MKVLWYFFTKPVKENSCGLLLMSISNLHNKNKLKNQTAMFSYFIYFACLRHLYFLISNGYCKNVKRRQARLARAIRAKKNY